MVDINATIIPLMAPLTQTIHYFMDTIKVLVGGLFGLYVIVFIHRIFMFRKLSKQIKKIFNELNEVNKRLKRLEKKKRSGKH